MKKVFSVIFFLVIIFVKAQNQNYFRTEIMVGKSIPSYQIRTGLHPKTIIGLSYAHKNYKPNGEWQSILNYPTTGISLYYTHFGNKENGNALSIIPFIEFYLHKKHKWSTKFGMGAAYFDTKYHPINNPNYDAIGSDLTWAIQGFLHYDLVFKNAFDVRLGLGVFHHSNGHIKLPNKGLNTALISVSTTFNKNSNGIIETIDSFNTSKVKKFGKGFYSIRYGNGIQSFLTDDSAVKSVHTLAIKGGVFYKNIVRLSMGMTYRFYQHYYDYIIDNQVTSFNENPKLNASNVFISVGSEVLLGRVGIALETGINLYKPFYRTHYNLQRTSSESQFKFKKRIVGRMGLKLYAVNTNKKPKNNFYLSANINSNFGQADFSELSLGFVHRIVKK